MDKKLVSIITPTYNHEKYIKQCIDSVLAQTYPYWEQIIIDDGSTDKTADIIARYDDKRIIYIKQENQGIHHLDKTYNKALKTSRGDYIAVLEGDDYWPEYKLEKQIKTFQDHDVVLCCGNAEMIDDQGEPKGLVNKLDSLPEILLTNETLDRLLLKNFITACTVLCDKKALVEIGGFQKPINSPFVDYPTWLELSRLGNFYFDQEVMGYWRRHRGQISTKKALEMLKSQWSYSIKFFNELSGEDKRRLKIDLEDIKRQKNKDFNELYYLWGRKCLYNQKWAKSREYFKKSVKGSPIIKFYSIIGVICSYLRIDMEKYISMVKRTHIDDLIE